MKSQPRECPFHDPALGLHDKTAAVVGPLDDLKAQRMAGTKPRQLRHQRAGVPTISPDHPQPREAVRQFFHYALGSGTILRASGMDDDYQQQAQHVDQKVALASRHLLPRVIAALLAPPLCRLHALRIQNRRSGLRFAPGELPHQGTKAIVDALPHASHAPPPEIAVDSRPGRILPGQIPPCNPATDNIEKGVEDQTHIRGSGSPTGVSWWDQWFDKMPFSVGEIARVELVAHAHMLSQPTETF